MHICLSGLPIVYRESGQGCGCIVFAEAVDVSTICLCGGRWRDAHMYKHVCSMTGMNTTTNTIPLMGP